jgi:hypothetical protein
MPQKTPKPINLAAAQAETTKYVKDYLNNTPLGLPNLDESDFTQVMNAVVKAMSNAWAAGYMKRNEEV